MSEAIEKVLRGAGLTDKPGEFDSSIHSWRCEHPQTYGPCECFQELVRELVEVERAAAEKALTDAAEFLREHTDGAGMLGYIKSDGTDAYETPADWLRARAEAYQQGETE